MLFRPEAFEPLTDTPWSEGRVRDAIAAIVRDTEAAYDPDRLWDDELDLFAGAAGVVFALDALRRRGSAEVRINLAEAALRMLELWRERARHELGLLGGESGMLVVAWRLTRDPALADRLLACIHENVGNDANELMWGAPGTLIASHAMHAWTGEPRWRDAWAESAAEVRRRRDADGLWTQRLGRFESRYLGPAHGATGNVLALLQGNPAEDVQAIAEKLAEAVVLEDGLANWPPVDGDDLESAKDGQIRVQWCHGAPGIVSSASSYLPEELFLAGAELTWRAGPHRDKGPGICHGTAGNGYAFLKAFERTGDERWLERARRFAVHALEQLEHRERRHAIWLGDLGVALYAADCLDARTRYPVLETWD